MKPIARLIALTAIFTGILFTYSGCEKATYTEGYDVFLPQELKDVFYYKPGSWWIMQNTAATTNDLDSIYVLEANLDTIDIINPGSQQAYAKKEVFRVKCFSSFYNQEFHYVSESSDLCGNLSTREPCHFVMLEQYRNNQRGQFSRVYYYTAELDEGWTANPYSIGTTWVTIAAVKNDFEVSAGNFDQVRQVDVFRDGTAQNANTTRYFAQNVGLLRYVVSGQATDWQLVRKNVVQ